MACITIKAIPQTKLAKFEIIIPLLLKSKVFEVKEVRVEGLQCYADLINRISEI